MPTQDAGGGHHAETSLRLGAAALGIAGFVLGLWVQGGASHLFDLDSSAFAAVTGTAGREPGSLLRRPLLPRMPAACHRLSSKSQAAIDHQIVAGDVIGII